MTGFWNCDFVSPSSTADLACPLLFEQHQAGAGRRCPGSWFSLTPSSHLLGCIIRAFVSLLVVSGWQCLDVFTSYVKNWENTRSLMWDGEADWVSQSSAMSQETNLGNLCKLPSFEVIRKTKTSQKTHFQNIPYRYALGEQLSPWWLSLHIRVRTAQRWQCSVPEETGLGALRWPSNLIWTNSWTLSLSYCTVSLLL